RSRGRAVSGAYRRRRSRGLRHDSFARAHQPACRRVTIMEEPTILKFPVSRQSPATAVREEVDLSLLLRAWNEATDRLQHTPEALQPEVRPPTDELEAKNHDLARKNRLADLGQMASHVAHEVRNSLVPMKLYLSLLRRRIDQDRG